MWPYVIGAGIMLLIELVAVAIAITVGSAAAGRDRPWDGDR